LAQGMPTITRTGYIGIGNIGKAVAENVVAGGFDLMVYDVRPEAMDELAKRGARTADCPREVGAHAELIEISVVDDAQVLDVIAGPDGILAGAKPGAIIAIHSTIHPRTAKKAAEIAQERGVGVIDACLSGGQSGARAHTLVYMVGGDAALVERSRPVFETSGSDILHVGDVGMGAATKLAQQVMICLNRLSAFEGMQLAEKAGVNLDKLQQIVHLTNAQSAFADNWTEHRRSAWVGTEQAAGVAHAFWKGLNPALELGHELGLPMLATALVQQLFPQILGMED